MAILLINLSYGNEYKLELNEDQTKALLEKYQRNYDSIAREIKLENEKILLSVISELKNKK